MKRLYHALNRYDPSMRHDPFGSAVQGVVAGVMVAALTAGGAVALAFFKPQGMGENARIMQVSGSSELLVSIDSNLHPALNLVSAQLIVGSSEAPMVVSSAAVQDLPRGPLVGIGGAPTQVFQPSQTDSVWAACDIIDHPQAAQPVAHSAVIAGDEQRILVEDSSATRIVLGPDGWTWMLWAGKRHSIDVSDTALVLGLGLQANPRLETISPELFNAIPAGRPITAPVITDAGKPTSYAVAPGVVVGTILHVPQVAAGAPEWYVALDDGVQPISEAMAEVIRNSDAHGALTAPTVAQDVVAHLPTASSGLDLSEFPDEVLHSVTGVEAPITCWQWVKRSGEQQAQATVSFLATLPLSNEQHRLWRHDLVSLPTEAMYAAPGSGFFVQTTGSDPRSPANETLWWVSDAGVRYGLMPAVDEGVSTSAALGLSAPIQAPWAVLAMLVAGPGLSKQAALVGRDTVPPDPMAGALVDIQEGTGL